MEEVLHYVKADGRTPEGYKSWQADAVPREYASTLGTAHKDTS